MPERRYYIWDLKEEVETWEKFYYFAESYKRAYRLLLEEERTREGINNEEDILPALHLFSQYLELIFKSLLIKKGYNMEKLIKGAKGHNISKLYNIVKENYPDFNLDKKLILFIEDLANMNVNGQPFRYPINSKGENLWIHECEGRHFNLSGIYVTTAMVTNSIDQYLKKTVLI